MFYGSIVVVLGFSCRVIFLRSNLGFVCVMLFGFSLHNKVGVRLGFITPVNSLYFTVVEIFLTW